MRAALSSRRRLLGALHAVLLTLMGLAAGGCKERQPAPAPAAPALAPAAASAPRPTPDPDANHTPGTIVVLGSSTAAGIGPRDGNSAWVRRYEAYLHRKFPGFTLVNHAVGGQTSYHIQPDGFAPPRNRPAPTPGKNISAALALNPDGIIINMPSNDAAAGISHAEQLANFERVAAHTHGTRALLWVSTTQPRNFETPAQLLSLERARQSLLRRFEPHALDFWTPFANADGSLKPEYDAGDGTHMNDAAHAILTETVIAAGIPERILSARR